MTGTGAEPGSRAGRGNRATGPRFPRPAREPGSAPVPVIPRLAGNRRLPLSHPTRRAGDPVPPGRRGRARRVGGHHLRHDGRGHDPARLAARARGARDLAAAVFPVARLPSALAQAVPAGEETGEFGARRRARDARRAARREGVRTGGAGDRAVRRPLARGRDGAPAARAGPRPLRCPPRTHHRARHGRRTPDRRGARPLRPPDPGAAAAGDGLPGAAVSAPQDDQPESRDVPVILCQRGASVRALGRAARRPRAAPRGSRRAGDRRRDLSQRLVRLRSDAASA